MKIIYIAGPFRGENAWQVEQNIREAEKLGFWVANQGAMPLIPHTNTRFFDGTLSQNFWLDGTLELLRRCDAMVMTPLWRSSSGACSEVEEAKRLDIPTYDSGIDDQLIEFVQWLANENIREAVEE